MCALTKVRTVLNMSELQIADSVRFFNHINSSTREQTRNVPFKCNTPSVLTYRLQNDDTCARNTAELLLKFTFDQLTAHWHNLIIHYMIIHNNVYFSITINQLKMITKFKNAC